MRLGFCHIPKTGGSSVRNALRKMIPGKRVGLPNVMVKGKKRPSWAMMEAQAADAALVSGHVPYWFFKNADWRFVVLREPVRRAYSHILDIQRNRKPSRTVSQILDNDDLRDYELTNLQVRMLGEGVLENAKQALSDPRTIVTDTDNLQDGIDRLAEAMGVKSVKVEHRNKAEPYIIPPGPMKDLQRLNEQDCELYSWWVRR